MNIYIGSKSAGMRPALCNHSHSQLKLSTPMISATVELFELTFCLFDRENTPPLPNINITPV